MTEFGTAFGCQNGPKSLPNVIHRHVCFVRVFMPFLSSEAVEAATVEDAVDEAKYLPVRHQISEMSANTIEQH